MSSAILRAMAVFSWCASYLMPSVKPKPPFSELWAELRHPSKEPFS